MTLSTNWKRDQQIANMEDFKRMYEMYCEEMESYFHRFTEEEQDVIEKMDTILERFKIQLENEIEII